MKPTITGEENLKRNKEIAEGMSNQLLASAMKGNQKQMQNAIEISKWTSIYTLGSIVFNEAMRASDHDLKGMNSHIMQSLDEIKEAILEEVDRTKEGFVNGDVAYQETDK